MRRVHRLQVRVGLVEAVLLPVLAEQLGVPIPVAAGGVAADAAAVRVLVDVIAEADDEIEVRLVGDRPLGVVEPGLVVLAGVEGDSDRGGGVERWGGLEAADRRLVVLRDEAVVVGTVGLQALDEGAGGEVALLAP
jgi:hypothetical protein